MPSLALAEVADYFGVSKLSAVTGGFDAFLRYPIYAGTQPGAAKEALREELLEYNRDDLVALVAVAEGFRRLGEPARGPAVAPAA